MPRRFISNKQKTEVELFPFLSVLACTIGTLVLLIVVLTTQALKPQEAVVVAKTDVQVKTDKNGKGSNQKKAPVYIEARKDGFILYPGKKFAPRTDLYDKKSALRKTIANLKANKQKQYLILILRPDGLEMFDKARLLVQGQGIDIGYEPLEYGLELKIES
jgi:biopolymer transport protein ExbD